MEIIQPRIDEIEIDRVAYRDVERIFASWMTLVRSRYPDHPAAYSSWFRNWVEAFAQNMAVTIFCLRRGSELVGVVPIVQSEANYRLIRVKKIGLPSNGVTETSDLLIHPCLDKIAAELLEVILSRPDLDWDLADFTSLTTNANTYTVIQELVSSYGSLELDGDDIPFLEINGTWEEFLRSKSVRFRKKYRNRMNRITKSISAVEVVRLATNADIRSHWDVLLEISRASWKYETGRSLVHQTDQQVFLRQFIDSPDEEVPKPIVYILFFDEEPVAFEFHVHAGNTASVLRADFVEKHARLSPGAYLECEIIHDVFDEESRQIKEYNTCGAGYEYLRKLTDQSRPHSRFLLFNQTPRGRLARGMSKIPNPFNENSPGSSVRIPDPIAIRAQDRLREEGVGSALSALLARLFHYNSASWYSLDLTVPGSSPASDGPELGIASPDEIEVWLKQLGLQFGFAWNAREMECAGRMRHVFVVIREKEQLIGYMKIGINRVYVEDFDEEIELPQGLAFIYDSFVHPGNRGRRILVRAISFAAEEMRHRGFKVLACHIPGSNIASIKSYTYAGFVPSGKIRFLQVSLFRLFSMRPEKMLARIASALS